MKNRILLVEDEETARRVIEEYLKGKGYEVFSSETGKEAIKIFTEKEVELVILDWKLPDMEGDEVFERIRELNPIVPVIFITAYGEIEKAVKVLKMGAYYYLTKPIELENLYHLIKEAISKHNLIKENELLKKRVNEKFSIKNFIYSSSKMEEVVNLAMRVAQSEATVLITGESGTGKELLANIIHNFSKRKDGPFVKINIASIPATLIESELFGAEKGAYTGAYQARKGKFEEADGGTIFLDEIGEMPLEVQVKLLRVLQEKEITRLGSNKPKKIDVRIISATNKDLKKEVEEGRFREDLYYRLNVINIHIPPLRERKDEIPLLVDFFIRKFSERESKEIKGITKEALSLLLKYNFPGNVRELENIIERAVVLARDEYITREDLPFHLSTDDSLEFIEGLDELSLPERLKEIERRIIIKALKKNRLIKTKAAKELGISESTLRYRIESLGIDLDQLI